jgi:hypothetical protein
MLTTRPPKLLAGRYLPAYQDGTDRVFQNIGISSADAGESPRKKHTAFRTRQKYEIKNN